MSCPETYRALIGPPVKVKHTAMGVMEIVNRMAASVVGGKTRTTAGIEPLYRTSYKRTVRSAPPAEEVGDE